MEAYQAATLLGHCGKKRIAKGFVVLWLVIQPQEKKAPSPKYRMTQIFVELGDRCLMCINLSLGRGRETESKREVSNRMMTCFDSSVRYPARIDKGVDGSS